MTEAPHICRDIRKIKSTSRIRVWLCQDSTCQRLWAVRENKRGVLVAPIKSFSVVEDQKPKDQVREDFFREFMEQLVQFLAISHNSTYDKIGIAINNLYRDDEEAHVGLIQKIVDRTGIDKQIVREFFVEFRSFQRKSLP